MSLLGHFVYNIRNAPRAGQGNSDDNKLNPRNVEYWIQYHRAAIISEDINSGKPVDGSMVQDLGIVPLTEVDMTDQNCNEYLKWGCTIKKAVIPTPITNKSGSPSLWIGFIDKISPIIISNPNHVFFREKTHFGKNVNRCWLIGNNLYFLFKDNFKKTKYINIRGLFQDPKDAYKYATPGCDSVCFNPLVDQYPLTDAMYKRIVDRIFRTELQIVSNSKTDQINDGREDT